ncbi:hypothetical protein TSUD_120370 [Trifolium subterraneum]|uniref:Reverse transcriptase domain-containing protein n=1 Tax=Trifolium subterraneum TaxID=3900 RepID=A0A2Z6M6I5_TRISU|nr:hypothetical protein TSUD_120370 [Trifolium subterraneum]
MLSYFVTLIPKVPCPSELGEFRPISLLGCLYKLIAKVLAARLAKVMDTVVASTQSAFIKGRNLVDGVMVVNEVIDLARKTGRKCLVLKVDFEKAYDSVDWGFLEYMLRRFGFGLKWIEWIRACVFAGNLSVLVNGCPTSEINIQRGLKQGDPLAPFLFLLVGEGLAGLMRSAVCKNLFKGFDVGSDGVNVPSQFMLAACNFLNCKQGFIPFTYLGIPVGANPRRCSTWDPLVDKLRSRLRSWGNRFISLGGRIVLINSVLNAIPTFHLSFMKMPATVIKKIVRIQREFLWGGVKGGRKISWWRWRLLQKENALWKEVLVAKYGIKACLNVHWIGCELPRTSSPWWRDICGLDAKEGGSWFDQHMSKVVGNGESTRFWFDCWSGNKPLCDRFPRLFSVSSQQNSMVRDVVGDGSGLLRWDLGWRRRLFVWEQEQLSVMLDGLPGIEFSEREDKWRWDQEDDGRFSVMSAYLLLGKIFTEDSMFSTQELKVFRTIWKSQAPSKVIAFSWKLLRNRIPTKRNLANRGVQISGGSLDCVHCHGVEESMVHLFLFCDFATQVWNAIFRWLGLVIIMPPNPFLLFDYFIGAARNNKLRIGFLLIWHATVWSLWRLRNEVIFSNGAKEIETVVDAIKLQSWKWGVSRHQIPICLFYEWCWDPELCLTR